MKKTPLFLLAWLCMHCAAFSQSAPSTAPHKMTYSVKELNKTNWIQPKGLPYVQVPGANLGVTSFEVMDKNRVAYLSDASSEIYICDRVNGKITSSFHVVNGPSDFAFDQNEFYVLGGSELAVYDIQGKQLKHIALPESLLGAGRIARVNKTTWILLPSGNSMQIDAQTDKVSPVLSKGWITTSGSLVSTAITGANTYSVALHTAAGKSVEKTFTSDKKLAGVYVVGSTHNRIVVDVQTYITESPISVERHLVSIACSSSAIDEIAADIKLPDCYYVLSNKELQVLSNGHVLEMITAPAGVLLFSLSETDHLKAQDFPAALRSEKYHFNDHLLKTTEPK